LQNFTLAGNSMTAHKLFTLITLVSAAVALLASCGSTSGRTDGDELDGDFDSQPVVDGDFSDGTDDGPNVTTDGDNDREDDIIATPDGDFADNDQDENLDCLAVPCASGICDPQTLTCVDCLSDSDCENLFQCDLVRHECFFAGCYHDSDCPNDLNCARASGQCVECIEDFHCGVGICDRQTNMCTQTDCQDDSLEPNDNSREAVELGNATLSKLKLCPPDQDWYRLSTGVGDGLNVQVGTDSQINVRIVHSDSGETVYEKSTSSTLIDEITTLKWGGEYWLIVESDQSTAVSYTLGIERLRRAATCSDDGLEENDGRSKARQLSSGQTQLDGLTACPGDPDWYALDLNSGDSFKATLGASAELDFALFSPELAQLDGGLGVENIEIESAHLSGTYLIRVMQAVEQGQTEGITYSLSLSHTQQHLCIDDEAEPDDNFTQSHILAPDQIISRRLCPADSDWFSVYLATGDIVQLDLNLTRNIARLRLTDHRGLTTLAQSQDSQGGQSLSVEVLRGGLFGLVIEPMAFNEPQSYELSLDIEAATACPDDRFENNDTYSDASTLTDGGYDDLMLCTGDDDWYWFFAEQDERIEIDILFDNSIGDLDAYLYDPDGYLTAASEGAEDDERIDVTVPVAGGYWLLITGYDGAAAPYLLDMQLSSTTPPCEDDGYEPNNISGQAVALPDDADLNLILCPENPDWFSATLNTNETLTVMVSRSTDGPILVNLYDASNSSLLSSDSDPYGTGIVYAQANRDSQKMLVSISVNGLSHPVFYRLETLVSQPICQDDRLEENDTLDSAYLTDDHENLQSLVLCSGNEDWYALIIPEGAVLLAEVSFRHSEGDLDLYAYDGLGRLLKSSISESDYEQIELAPLPDEDIIYLRVIGYDGAQASYDLTLVVDEF
jgi:hypothetical protein